MSNSNGRLQAEGKKGEEKPAKNAKRLGNIFTRSVKTVIDKKILLKDTHKQSKLGKGGLMFKDEQHEKRSMTHSSNDSDDDDNDESDMSQNY